MALVMLVVGASGLACWLVAVLLLPYRPRRRSSKPDAEPRNPSREEDLVRPAVTASGERIWIDPDEMVWHEIVGWPKLKVTARGKEKRRRSA